MDKRGLKGKFTKTYISAFVTIALLISAAYVYSAITHYDQALGPQVINKSGKQRMLSQRIALLHELLVSPKRLSIEERQTIQRELRFRAQEFLINHEMITGFQPIDGRLHDLSPSLKQYYFGEGYSLDQRVRDYAQAALAVSDMTPLQLINQERHSIGQVTAILNQLDVAVRMFEDELKASFERQQRADLLFWLAINACLIVCFIVFFKPLEKLMLSQAELKNSSAKPDRSANSRNRQIRSEYVAKLSHEFRTPMNAIIGTLELLPNMQEKQDVLTKRGERACYRLLRLTNNLLDILDDEQQNQLPPRVPFDLIRLLDDAISPISAVARDKSLDLYVNCQQTLPHYVEGYPSAISKALENILDNAVKFTEKGEISVSIGVSVENKQIKLTVEVTDSGIGMRANDTTIIFERFTQVYSGPRYRYSGAGVGLAVAKEQVSPIGGTIRVVSDIGAGSTFTLEVPLYPSNITSLDISQTVSGKFAVIDDIEISRLHLENLIKTEGYSVDIFESAAEFLSKKDQIPGYLGIFTDYFMPGINGVELAEAINAMFSGKAPPVILLSATPDIANIVALSDAKVWQTFVKPLDINRFIDSLHQVSSRNKHPILSKKDASVLIVEDEPINAEIIQHMVNNLGYKTTHVSDGEDAINLCSTSSFDVILMDISLPDVSGIEVARILREKGITTPIVAVTAHGYESDKLETKQAGMRYHLVKPVSYQELKNTLSLSISLEHVIKAS